MKRKKEQEVDAASVQPTIIRLTPTIYPNVVPTVRRRVVVPKQPLTLASWLKDHQSTITYTHPALYVGKATASSSSVSSTTPAVSSKETVGLVKKEQQKKLKTAVKKPRGKKAKANSASAAAAATATSDTTSDIKPENDTLKQEASEKQPNTEEEESDTTAVEVDPVQQLKLNIDRIEEFVSRASADRRLAQYQIMVECIDTKLKIPPTSWKEIGVHRDLEMEREHFLEEMRLIRRPSPNEPSIEEKTFQERNAQFWKLLHQYPIEQQPAKMMDLFIQFFQPDDSIPDMDVKDYCPKCQGPLQVLKKEAMLLCRRCGLVQPFLTIRSNVRVVPPKQALLTATPENKQWNRFRAALVQHKEGESPVTRDMLERVADWICEHKNVRVGQPVKQSMVQTAFVQLGFKGFNLWVAKACDDINGTPKPTFTVAQFAEMDARFQTVQSMYQKHRPDAPVLLLPGPRVLYHYVCEMNGWTSLQGLYPISDLERDQGKEYLDRFLLQLLNDSPTKENNTTSTNKKPGASTLIWKSWDTVYNVVKKEPSVASFLHLSKQVSK